MRPTLMAADRTRYAVLIADGIASVAGQQEWALGQPASLRRLWTRVRGLWIDASFGGIRVPVRVRGGQGQAVAWSPRGAVRWASASGRLVWGVNGEASQKAAVSSGR